MRFLLALGRRIGRDGGAPPRRRRVTPDDQGHDRIALSDEDTALVARLRAGETTAFRALVDQYGDGALRVAYRILHSRDAARDALQNVLSDWWVRRAELAPRPSLRAYLFTAVRYQALSELRRSNVRTGVRPLAGVAANGLVDPDTLPAHNDESVLDGRLTVDALLARLPERRRLVVQLRYLEQLSYAEIARIMGISAKAVEHLVLRSLEALRQAL